MPTRSTPSERRVSTGRRPRPCERSRPAGGDPRRRRSHRRRSSADGRRRPRRPTSPRPVDARRPPRRSRRRRRRRQPPTTDRTTRPARRELDEHRTPASRARTRIASTRMGTGTVTVTRTRRHLAQRRPASVTDRGPLRHRAHHRPRAAATARPARRPRRRRDPRVQRQLVAESCAVTLTRRQALDLLDRHGLSAQPGARSELRRRPQHRAAHRPAGGRRPRRPVVEVGAGLGSLTLALAEAGRRRSPPSRLDRHLLPGARTRCRGVDPVRRVVHGDALTAGLGRPARRTPTHWALVANLPYNVATPLVLDVLDRVPRSTRMLVMVQREVGERLAARAGTSAYGIPSVKVAYWATAEVVGRVAPERVPAEAEGRVGAGAHRASRRPGHRLPTRTVCSTLVRAGVRPAPQDAAPVARRPWSRRRLRSRRASRPDARAEELGRRGSGGGWPRRCRRSDRAPAGRRVGAPAKLTLSLRVTGVRAGRLHLIDAEMVTLDLVDTLRFDDGDGVDIRRPHGRGPPSRTTPTSCAGPSRWSAGSAHVDGRQAHPGRGGARRRLGRRRRGPAVGRCRRPRGSRPRPRGRRPVLPARRPGAGHRRRRDARAAAAAGPGVHAGDAAVRLLDGGGLPRLGRPGRPDGRRTATTSSPPRWWSSRGWRRGATGSARRPASSPDLAGSGSTWFVEGEFPGDGPRRRADRRSALSGRRRESSGYLPARRCQRVRFSIFLCFFLRMRLRRFLISEPMSAPRLPARDRLGDYDDGHPPLIGVAQVSGSVGTRGRRPGRAGRASAR